MGWPLVRRVRLQLVAGREYYRRQEHTETSERISFQTGLTGFAGLGPPGVPERRVRFHEHLPATKPILLILKILSKKGVAALARSTNQIRTFGRRAGSPTHRRTVLRAGFTLVEVLLAVGLMAVVSTVAFLSYDGAVRAWRAGQEMSASLHQSDFVMDQLAMGLRSASWRGAPATGYGFNLKDDGEGPEARDSISWVKLGTALVGVDASYAGMPHAVEVSIRDVEDARGTVRHGLAVRAWRLDLQQKDFDADKVPCILLSTRVIGFNCRVLDPVQPLATETGRPDLKWADEWLDTNKLPYAVELTLYVTPPEKDKEPVAIKRIVRLPMAAQSWGK